MEMKTLWLNRWKDHFERLMKYYSIVGMNVFYSLIIVLAVIYFFFYKLQEKYANFPTEMIPAFLLGAFLYQSMLRSFVKHPDILFLSAFGTRIKGYFQYTFLYNTLLQLGKALLLMLLMSPFLVKEFLFTFYFIPLLIVVVSLNSCFLWVEQWMESRITVIQKIIRLLANWAAFYYLLTGNWSVAIGILLLLFGWLLFVFPKKDKAVQWQYFIDQEEKSLQRTYKFLNNYIDINNIKQNFRPRFFLTNILKFILPYGRKWSYYYLFTHLFVRNNTYFWLFLRLSLLGLLFIYSFPKAGWLIIVLVLLMTSHQIFPLSRGRNEMIRLYPIHDSAVNKSFHNVLIGILFLQLIVLGIASLVF